MVKHNYIVRHDFECIPNEWGETHVEHFCEAINWFTCKQAGRSIEKRVISLIHNGTVVKSVRL
jgi:hypothetical protein